MKRGLTKILAKCDDLWPLFVKEEAFLVVITFWPLVTFIDLWQKTCGWLFVLLCQLTYDQQVWWKSDIVLNFARVQFNDL